ncbi:MAG: restriction endonuclease subunit S [Candidatus Brocadiia bacterium]
MKIKNIANIKMGRSPKGEMCSEEEIGLPLLNGPTEFGPHHPQPEQYTDDPKKRAEPGDLLFCVRGSSTGRMNWADREYAIGRGLAALRHKKGLRYNHFLRGLLELYLPALLKAATGSTFPNVSKGLLSDFEVLVPDLDEQEKISKILRTFDDKIELNRRMNKTLESTARTLFKSWFVDFDPVIDNAVRAGNPIPEEFGDRAAARRKALDAGNPVVADDMAEHFPAAFEESDQGPIPVGWEIRALDEIADYLNGTAWQRYRAEGDEESLPVIKIRELRDGFSDNTDRASLDVPDKYIIEDGDVIFSWSGSLLVKLWTGGRGVLNQHLFKVSSVRFPKWFYYLWTVEHLERFQRIAADKATTMGHIKRAHLSEAKVLVPSEELLNTMGKAIAPPIGRQIHNELEIRTLTKSRDALLPNLLSGKVRVPDVGLSEEIVQ